MFVGLRTVELYCLAGYVQVENQENRPGFEVRQRWQQSWMNLSMDECGRAIANKIATRIRPE